LPVITEIHETVLELDRLQRQLDRVNTSLALFDRPARFLFLNGGIYVLLPSLLLLAAHYLVTVAMNVSPLYLRIASVIIPMPFGMAAFALSKIGYRGAFGLGALTAAVSVTGMFAVVAYLDGTSMVPATLQEWRETFEYGLSIALAFLTGNILVILVLFILPSTIASSGSPITPVEARKTCDGLQRVAAAAILAVSLVASRPDLPVKALALPELTTSTLATPCLSCARHQSTGADGHFDRVNTPATVVPGSNSANSTSIRPG